MRLCGDMIEWCTQRMPRWHPISVSGYHIREAGSTAAQELAFTIKDGLTYVEQAIERGLDVDDFAPRLSFFFNAQIDFFEEIAKLRAARRIWARELRETYGAKDPRSWRMRFHTQTAGVSLTAQQPLNNVVRTAIEALAGVLGGTQSLHTNSYDEALALPTEDAARIALRTQQIIAHETGVTNTIDPLGGAYFVEALTDGLEREAYDYFARIDELGGMVEAVKANFPQREIADAAYALQGEYDSHERILVGVNDYVDAGDAEIPTLRIDPELERKQTGRLQAVRARRDGAAVERSLAALRAEAARDRRQPDAGAAGLRALERQRGRDRARAAGRLRDLPRDAGLLARCRERRSPSLSAVAAREQVVNAPARAELEAQPDVTLRSVLAGPIVAVVTVLAALWATHEAGVAFTDPDHVGARRLALVVCLALVLVVLDIVVRGARRTPGWKPTLAGMAEVRRNRWTRQQGIAVGSALGRLLRDLRRVSQPQERPAAAATRRALRPPAGRLRPHAVLRQRPGHAAAQRARHGRLDAGAVERLRLVRLPDAAVAGLRARLRLAAARRAVLRDGAVDQLGTRRGELPAVARARADLLRAAELRRAARLARLLPAGPAARPAAGVPRRPQCPGAAQNIAAFASLHCSLLFTAAMAAQLLGIPKRLQIGLWVLFGVSAVSTVHLGWHYVIDDVAGVAIAFAALGLAKLLTGIDPRTARRRVRAPEAEI